MHLAPIQNLSHGKLLLLAPPEARIPRRFVDVRIDPRRHERLLREMQRFRGRLYSQDDAISPSDLSSDGRHELPVDGRAWHLLALDEAGDICTCVRYVVHSNTIAFQHLGIQDAALAHSNQWGTQLKAAVDSQVELARSRGLAFVELGGWALAPALRHTAEALRIALATYSLARSLGGCIGITTATERHHSASILQRIGGMPLALHGVDLPLYYDPQYRCRMQVLRFDSGKLNPRFEPWVTDLSSYIETLPVIRATPQSKWAAACDATSSLWSLKQNLVPAVQ